MCFILQDSIEQHTAIREAKRSLRMNYEGRVFSKRASLSQISEENHEVDFFAGNNNQ